MQETEVLKKDEKCEVLDDTTLTKTTKFKKILISVLISISALLLISIIFVFCLIFTCSSNKYIEIDEKPEINLFINNPVTHVFCEIKTDLSEINTSKISSSKIELCFFGFIDRTTTLYVVDTTPPELSVKSVVTTIGSDITGDMFVLSLNDKTHVKTSLDKDISKLDEGKHSVILTATDEGGNTSEYSTTVEIIASKSPLFFEYGTPLDTIEKALQSMFKNTVEFELPAPDECAKLTVRGKDNNSLYYINIEIDDIIKPTATINSFDLVLGETITQDNIITDIFDHSKVKVNMSELPDFEKSGEHIVNITLTDEYDNTSEYVSYIRVHDINTEISVEINSHNADITEKIFNNDFSKRNLAFTKENFFNFLSIKETTVTLKGKFNPIKIKAKVIDTVPPVLKLKYVEKIITKAVSPEEFVYICNDSTEVTYSFVGEPSTKETGTFKVTVAATDACGNKTTATADLIVHGDTVPPEIHGLKDITTVLGRNPDYLNGVYATDEISEYMDLKVDSSAVDVNCVGVYPVVYTAIDQYDNITQSTIYVNVKENIRVCLDVKNIKQNPGLPNGCEVVSLAIVLKYNGFDVDPLWLFKNYMPAANIQSNADPWTTYIGDPTSAVLGCYAPCVVKTGNDYLSKQNSSMTVEDVSGQDFSTYEGYINNGIPVIMWGTTYMMDNDTLCRSWKADGKSVVWHYYSHCLVMIGYTEDTYIFCDPLRGVVEYSRSAVEKAFEINFKQACIIK